MRKSLGDLINAALSDADSSLKLASARDATTRDPGDYLTDELAYVPSLKMASEGSEEEKRETKAEEKAEHKGGKDEKSEKKASRQTVLDSASYGLKLAEALEVGANVMLRKFAAEETKDTDPRTKTRPVTVDLSGAGRSPITAPGPQVMESGFIGAQTVQPKAHSVVSDQITGPATTAGNLPTNIADHTGNLDGQQPPNNTGKTAGIARSKEASARLLRAKQAQAEMLLRLGQTKAAEELLQQVKAAQDPSSPGPELPAQSESFRLDTEPGPSTQIPENSGLISMTKAEAKDRSVRTATEYMTEPPKVDNAVAAHALATTGQKVSSVDPAVARAYLERAIKVASDPNADPRERVKAASIVSAIKTRTTPTPSLS
jgi:hypothetical protein